MDIFILLVGAIIGFIAGIVAMRKSCDIDTALKLYNMTNVSMLECVTHKIITQEQAHDIEDVFFKHIELIFKGIKASHGDSCKDKE